MSCLDYKQSGRYRKPRNRTFAHLVLFLHVHVTHLKGLRRIASYGEDNAGATIADSADYTDEDYTDNVESLISGAYQLRHLSGRHF